MKNIIITGGGFVNKGAQAMTFITVSELKKRFPDHEIYILSDVEIKRDKSELEKYNFKVICSYPIKFAKAQTNKILDLVCRIRNKSDYNNALSIYTNCDLMLDISGYSIGTDWRYKICNNFLDNIEFAKYFNIPVYLLPQSFGPFDYKDEEGFKIDKRSAELFPYVKQIFAREREGYEALINRYNLTNVTLANDLVLTSTIEDYDVYRSTYKLVVPEIKENSVAIIPNYKSFDFGNSDELMKFYSLLIDKLTKSGKNIYLINHSSMDFEYCKKIKALFSDNDRVINIEEDLSCVQFNEIVKKFDFVVASRFHSIVHSYKNLIPCIVLGWATKYYELTRLFNQEKYMFDVRKEINISDFEHSIDLIIEKLTNEKEIIKSRLIEVQNENVFDMLGV